MLSSLSGNFSGYPETFRIIQKISSLSGNFPGYPKTFQAIWKFSGSSGKYPAYPETFQALRKFFGQSGKYPDYLEIFQRVRKLPIAISGVTRKTFRTRKNFPYGNATLVPATQVFGPPWIIHPKVAFLGVHKRSRDFIAQNVLYISYFINIYHIRGEGII